MVNVDKNIVPDKSVRKTTMKAPARRPRNQELNSSKKLPESIKDRRKQKLNCSREQVINQLVNEEQIYTQEEAEELIDAFEERTGATVERLATIDEVENYDGEFWATKDGVTKLWCRGNGYWYVKEDSSDDPDDDWSFLDSSCENSSKKLNCAANSNYEYNLSEQAMQSMIDKIYSIPSDMAKVEKMSICRTADAKQEPVAMLIVNVVKGADNEGKRLANIQAQFPNKTVSVANSVPVTEEGLTEAFEKAKEIGEQYADELMVNSSKKLNCAAEDEVKITTESGNEVSLSDIQIIQNPSTNEISLFIKEDEDEEIPEGFTVIATAAQPALSEGEACPECGQDPCVCEGEAVEGEELDSSKKKN